MNGRSNGYIIDLNGRRSFRRTVRRRGERGGSGEGTRGCRGSGTWVMSACKETRRDGKSEGLIERERGTALDHLKSREASEIVIRYESLRGVTKKKNHDANVISSSPPGFLSISRSWSGLESRKGWRTWLLTSRILRLV